MQRSIWMAIPLALAIGVTGCASNDTQTGGQQQSDHGNTFGGAGIGAAVGAIAGALSGDGSTSRRDRALIGATAGAAIGGGVGAYMDAQEEKLRKDLDGTGIGVDRQGDNIVLNMPSSVTFDVDSSELRTPARQALNDATAVMREYPKTRINVAGYTDSTGSADYNQRLSERRAQSVADYLGEGGIASNRVATAGYGESQPVASNDTESGRAQNRRVEITLTPVTEQS
ncbi:OmpA family protein [Chromohalobacter canadensis]|uniref:OmpA family protein n=1 Tax=Chromohalobacter canadensis TaxID=141389 RepID=UPI0021BF741E|nr:OmpA family protein [Chromohalobacter canadensis]MCT8469083.1 OmpA family protein [Chromohalobacter canadensis]MCT8472727.1 OmpA family protein [Chromohalobacter canadensis]